MTVPFVSPRNTTRTLGETRINNFELGIDLNSSIHHQQTRLPDRLDLSGIGSKSVAELRGLRRQIAILCHPDRNTGEQKKQAHELMSAANRKIDDAINSRAKS